MKQIIYGIDITKEITPLMVRDAIVDCFFEAHCADSDVEAKDKDINKTYCKEIVKNAFEKAGVDFEKADKNGIILAMNELAEFSKKFRNQEIVQKHFDEIMELVNKIS